jgi:hypothetical protein
MAGLTGDDFFISRPLFHHKLDLDARIEFEEPHMNADGRYAMVCAMGLPNPPLTPPFVRGENSSCAALRLVLSGRRSDSPSL